MTRSNGHSEREILAEKLLKSSEKKYNWPQLIWKWTGYYTAQEETWRTLSRFTVMQARSLLLPIYANEMAKLCVSLAQTMAAQLNF